MGTPTWYSLSDLEVPRRYTCGYCGLAVGAKQGYVRTGPPPKGAGEVICPCPNCDKPTYFQGDRQVPGVAFGAAVEHLPADVGGLYTEARNCMAVSAYTASVLAARKLLMNVAVGVGSPHDRHLSFQDYVNYLNDTGYVPPNAKGWVDHIRKKGNEATHEIPAVTRADAEDVLTFAEMILKLVYDYPARVPAG
jgi:hypothetical protein